jgi:hypothetical protein
MSFRSIRRSTVRLVLLAVFVVLTSAADFPDVSKLPARPELPDPLVMFDAAAVVSKEQWLTKRRPELKALFEHYMYGSAPSAPTKVTAAVERLDMDYLGGKAVKKELAISFGPPDAPKIHLLLVVPKARRGTAPVFLGLNFHGNHTVANDPTIALPAVWVPRGPGSKDDRATEAGRGMQADAWQVGSVIDRGYALATFYSGDVAPDHPGHQDGVHPHYPGCDWGTVAAWAWGLSRAADYLQTDPDIDRTKMIVVGHSRMGKAALLAGAFDERFAMVIPLQAGCGGSAPSRGTVGESVKRINTSFPHWFNGAFKEFNDRPDRLPFDQNALVALVAPRPVLFSNATEDSWANPEGQFQVLKAAEPVYRLLGAGGLESAEMPETGKLAAGTLGYVIRPGKHSMTAVDWTFFLAFADKHLGRPR